MRETRTTRIDIDEFANMIGMKPRTLRNELLSIGITQIMDEAFRIQHGEMFREKNSDILNPPPPTLTHLKLAAANVLKLNLEDFTHD